MTKQENSKEVGAEVVEVTALSLKETKAFIDGKDGEIIELLDLQKAEGFLKGLAQKFSGFEVTKENRNKAAREAEKELRDARLVLQKANKSNKDYLNKAKKESDDVFKGLIDIISGVENEIKEGRKVIDESIKKEKEEQERKEKEEKERIEKLLKDAEVELSGLIIKASSEQDLVIYDRCLDVLESTFSEFGEYEFKAKRLHASFKGRRKELLSKIELVKQQEEERKKFEEEQARMNEMKDEIKAFRVQQLKEKGFESLGGEMVFTEEYYQETITLEEIISLNEIQWFGKLKNMTESMEEAKQKAEEEKQKEAKNVLKEWDSLIDSFERMGGDLNGWELSKGQIPDKADFERLKAAIAQVNEQKKILKAQGVRKELEPFKNEFLAFMSIYDAKVKGTEFKHSETRGILENLINRTAGVVDEVIGFEVNK